MKRFILLTFILCLALIPACVQTNNQEALLPEYLSKLADDEKIAEMEFLLTRDDLEITITPTTFFVSQLAQNLIEMDLTTVNSGTKKLDVANPFTLSFQRNGKEEHISITNGGITIEGVTYVPSNQKTLTEVIEADNEGFLTKDIYLLQDELPFTEQEIKQVRLEEHENYSDGVTKVDITNPKAISDIFSSLSNTVIRRFEPDEDPSMYFRVGGNGYFCTLIAQDGSEWTINSGGLTTITTSKEEREVLTISMDHDAVFGLLASTSTVPRLRPSIGNTEFLVFEKAYEVDKQRKSMSHIVPSGMYYTADQVLLPQKTYTSQLAWINTNGDAVFPESITAKVYQEQKGSIMELDTGTKLQQKGNTLVLPAAEGKYYVVVRAKLKDNSWVEHIFAYRCSIYPAEFYDIGYGNEDGDVVLRRNDVGVSVIGTQNRNYINFVQQLELTPSSGKPQSLPVHKPLTLEFLTKDATHRLILTEKGVTFNDQPYHVGNLQGIEDLYNVVDSPQEGMSTRIDYQIPGFLNREVANFMDQFLVDAKEIKTFTIIKQESEQSIRYDGSQMDSNKIEEILRKVVIVNGTPPRYHYSQKRYSLSFELTLKDGTSYEIGERLDKNGVDTGWYVIQRDSQLALEEIEGGE